MIKYDKLFERLKNKNISSYYIRKNKICGEATLTKLRNNDPVSIATIDKFCELLECQPNDIMEHVPDDSN